MVERASLIGRIFSIEELSKSWWVVLTLLFSYLVFCQAVQKKERDIDKLQSQYQVLFQQKDQLMQENRDLRLEIESQNDPLYVELVLKRVLGLIAEGEIKVFFDPK